MTDFVAGHAAALPDKAAIIDDRPGEATDTWTWDRLDRRANQLAHRLLAAGVTPQTKVIWCGQNSAFLVCAVHAIRRVAAVDVPLNYRLTADEAAYVIDNCDATVVIVDDEFTGLIESVRDRLPKVVEVLTFAAESGQLEAELDAMPYTPPPLPEGTGPARTMIYTSGTTGRPKGAVRANRVERAAGAGLLGMLGYSADDIYITTGPLYHSGPGGFARIAHLLGNTIVIQHRFDAEDWLRLVDRYRVTTTFSAPTPVRMICSLPAEVKARYDRSSMRCFIANAAPWTLALKRMYLEDFPPDSLWEVYGSTELGVDTVLAPADHLRKPGSCGRAAPGIEIKLFDSDGNEVTEPYRTGELYVRSAGNFDEYYKAEEKTRDSTRGEFRTVGDIAYFDEEGYFYIADRKADMIITGGMNVYPAEVEAALDEHPGIYEVAVFGIADEQWGETVHAVVVPADPALTADDVVAFARQHLAGYKVPRSVSFRSELPKTGSGKVLKRQLRDETTR